MIGRDELDQATADALDEAEGIGPDEWLVDRGIDPVAFAVWAAQFTGSERRSFGAMATGFQVGWMLRGEAGVDG